MALMACSFIEMYKKIIFYQAILILLVFGNGESTVTPKFTEAATGANVSLNCKSSTSTIEWHHFSADHNIHEIVYQDGYIFNGYKKRFTVTRNNNAEYNLLIHDVRATDTGKYTCVEKSEVVLQKATELIVFEQYPSNKSCAAKFTCAPVCDALELTCRMKAHGNIFPSMEWRDSANGILTSNSNIDNGITTSSIQLRPNSATSQSYSCHVIYPTNSSLISQFRWSFSVSVPVSLTPSTSDEKLQVQSNTESYTAVIMTFMATALVAMTVIILIQFFRNKRNEVQIPTSIRSRNAKLTDYKGSQNSLSLVDVRRHLMEPDSDDNARGFVPRTNLNKNKAIHGVGVLENELFFGTSYSCIIEVFDLESAKYKRALMIEGLVNPNDMAVCPTKNLIFICDWKKAAEHGEIICCDKNGKRNYRWIFESGRGRISVTKETNVIVAESWYNTIREYTCSGQLIKKLTTGKEKFHLWHAVKLENGNFVAGFGDTHDDIQQICVIDNQGKTLKFVNQDSIPEIAVNMSVPISLAVDKDGTIYVSDLYNRRIIILTPELQYKGEIVIGENEEKFRGPLRICIHESDDKRQVMIAESVKMNGIWTDGRVVVWNLNP